jgi:hypothetical protein
LLHINNKLNSSNEEEEVGPDSNWKLDIEQTIKGKGLRVKGSYDKHKSQYLQ